MWEACSGFWFTLFKGIGRPPSETSPSIALLTFLPVKDNSHDPWALTLCQTHWKLPSSQQLKELGTVIYPHFTDEQTDALGD